MKKVIGIILLLFVVSVYGYGQNRVMTEYSGGRYKQFVTAGTDTISPAAYLQSIIFGSIVSSDSIYVRCGSDTISTIIFGTAPAYPITVPFNCRVDSTLNVIAKKASKFTVIYRQVR